MGLKSDVYVAPPLSALVNCGQVVVSAVPCLVLVTACHCVCVCVCVWVGGCVCVWVGGWVWVWVCACGCVHVGVGMYVRGAGWVCVHICLSVCLSVLVHCVCSPVHLSEARLPLTCATCLCYVCPLQPSLIEDSETDSDEEEDGGYDSDVQREKDMDYVSKTYSHPARDATAGLKGSKVDKKPTGERK